MDLKPRLARQPGRRVRNHTCQVMSGRRAEIRSTARTPLAVGSLPKSSERTGLAKSGPCAARAPPRSLSLRGSLGSTVSAASKTDLGAFEGPPHGRTNEPRLRVTCPSHPPSPTPPRPFALDATRTDHVNEGGWRHARITFAIHRCQMSGIWKPDRRKKKSFATIDEVGHRRKLTVSRHSRTQAPRHPTINSRGSHHFPRPDDWQFDYAATDTYDETTPEIPL